MTSTTDLGLAIRATLRWPLGFTRSLQILELRKPSVELWKQGRHGCALGANVQAEFLAGFIGAFDVQQAIPTLDVQDGI